jgi:hypothetical protein
MGLYACIDIKEYVYMNIYLCINKYFNTDIDKYLCTSSLICVCNMHAYIYTCTNFTM